MPAYTLYTHPISHWCVSAEKMLRLKNVPFDTVVPPYNDHTGLIAASGQDYVPYLATGDGKGVTWDRIPDFLEERHPHPTLYPDGTRARARLVEDWAHQVVEEAVWKYVCSDAPNAIPEARGERWAFIEMQERKRGPLEVMAKRKPEFWPEVQRLCALAEDVLGDEPYLLGAAPSLADLALYGALSPLWTTGNALPAEAKRLHAWKLRIDAI